MTRVNVNEKTPLEEELSRKGVLAGNCRWSVLEGSDGAQHMLRYRKHELETVPRYFQKQRKFGPLCYMRIGSREFLDHRLMEDAESVGTETLFLHEFDTYLHHSIVDADYSSLGLHAISTLPLKGLNVLDLGSADGLMGLVARANGASEITAVDISAEHFIRLRRHFQVNNFDESSVKTLEGDLTKEACRRQLPENTHVVFANLGNGHYSFEPNRAAIHIAGTLPEVQFFVGSGYCASGDPLHSPDKDISLLEDYGFQVSDCISMHAHDHTKIAFTAQRKTL